MIGSSLVVMLVAGTFMLPADGAVVGVIRDAESGQVLPGATVAAVDVGRLAAADANGRYVLRGLIAGRHRLVVRALRHAPCEIHVEVPAAGTLELNVSLQALPTQLPLVEIRRVRDVRTDHATRDADRTLLMGDLTLHPQLAEPDALRGISGGDVSMAAETPGGLHVRGGTADQTGYALDGVPVFNPYHVSDLMGAWNTDALQSARLAQSSSLEGPLASLSGTLDLTTRTPGEFVRTRGGLSSSHARLEADGPLGIGSAGFLLSARNAFPAGVAPRADPTFVRGESSDWLTKVDVPLPAGRVSVFATRAVDQLHVATRVPDALATPVVSQREFGWSSTAASVQWRHSAGRHDSVGVLVWRSATTAYGTWANASMNSRRSDVAAEVSLSGRTTSGDWNAGLRTERTTTVYSVVDSSVRSPHLSSSAPVLTMFARGRRELGAGVGLGASGEVRRFGSKTYLTPGVRADWTLHHRLTVSASADRAVQFAQSVRNPESSVGFIFPADLFVTAGQGGIPVAVSSNVSATGGLRLTERWHAEVGGFARRMDGVVVIGANESGPFLRDTAPVGVAHVRGTYAGVTGEGTGYRALLRIGEQRVQYRVGEQTIVPSSAPRWSLDGGVTLLPNAATTLRLGLTAAGGRRVTPARGAIEWESCNLKDRGCEFSGEPMADTSRVGGVRLPNYVRLDLGLRHTHSLRLGARHAEIAWFATVSNVFGRFNVLTYALTDGRAAPIEMRPQSPFVVGLDWRF